MSRCGAVGETVNPDASRRARRPQQEPNDRDDWHCSDHRITRATECL